MITFLHKSWNYLEFIFMYRVEQGPIFMVSYMMVLFYIFWITNKNEHLFLCLLSRWIDSSSSLLIFLLNYLPIDLQEFFMWCGYYPCESYTLQISPSRLWLVFTMTISFFDNNWHCFGCLTELVEQGSGMCSIEVLEHSLSVY